MLQPNPTQLNCRPRRVKQLFCDIIRKVHCMLHGALRQASNAHVNQADLHHMLNSR